MQRKKILWLCSWYPGKTQPFNGDFIQRHAKAAALFNDIYVIHGIEDSSGKLQQSSEELAERDGVSEHIIYIKKTRSLWGRMISHYRWMAAMRQAIRQYISKQGKPDLVHVHVPIKAGVFGVWMKRKYGIPYVVTEHWGIYNDVEVHNYESRSKVFKHYTRQIFDQASFFVSVSRYLAEGVNKLVLKKAYEVVPNTVNTDMFFYKEKPSSRFRFIHVSNMVPLKNAEGILKAFKKMQEEGSDAELIMVGDTDPAIRKLADKLEVKNVLFRGEVFYQQVAQEMQSADAFILFSNIENSPCVIGEALCCGLPVITTNVGGIAELVDPSNAVFVPVGDEASLAIGMQTMIKNYGSFQRKKIAEDAIRKFSYPVIGKRLDDIYSSVKSGL